jgi:hypothetical protein
MSKKKSVNNLSSVNQLKILCFIVWSPDIIVIIVIIIIIILQLVHNLVDGEPLGLSLSSPETKKIFFKDKLYDINDSALCTKDLKWLFRM